MHDKIQIFSSNDPGRLQAQINDYIKNTEGPHEVDIVMSQSSSGSGQIYLNYTGTVYHLSKPKQDGYSRQPINASEWGSISFRQRNDGTSERLFSMSEIAHAICHGKADYPDSFVTPEHAQQFVQAIEQDLNPKIAVNTDNMRITMVDEAPIPSPDEEKLRQLDVAFKSFKSSLAFAAPEMFEMHIDTLHERIKGLFD